MSNAEMVLEATEGNGAMQKIWSLDLCPNSIQFTRDHDGASFILAQKYFSKKLEMVDGLIFQRTLMVSLGEKDTKHIFHFDKLTFRKLKEWFGPPSLMELGLTLRKRMRWTIFLGAALIVSALPQDAHPASGLVAVGFNYLHGVLGVLVILGGLAHMLKPHCKLFLLDSFFFVGLGVLTTISLFEGNHWAWGLLIPVDAYLVITGITQYLQYKDTLGQ